MASARMLAQFHMTVLVSATHFRFPLSAIVRAHGAALLRRLARGVEHGAGVLPQCTLLAGVRLRAHLLTDRLRRA
jgi:hypothetical protein